MGAGQRGYVGRAEGFERKQVPLSTSMEKADMSGSGAQMRAWRAFDAILSRFRGIQDRSLADSCQADAAQEVSLATMGFVLPDYTSPSTVPPLLPSAAWPAPSASTEAKEEANSAVELTTTPQSRRTTGRRCWTSADTRQALLDELDHLDLTELAGSESVGEALHELRATAEAGGQELEKLATNVRAAALEASKGAAKQQLQEWRERAQAAVMAGGRRAHRFLKDLPQVRGPTAPEGWPLQGDAAAQATHDEWL
eukprot:2023270-Pyramimonas_sp.AAC.1